MLARWLPTLRAAPRWASTGTPPLSTFHTKIALLNVQLNIRTFSAESSALTAQQRVEVELRESDLNESFVKGSGKGGQKINKVRNSVLLTHVPTGLQVQCQKTRSLDGNRRAARKLLLQKLDDHVNGAFSKRSQKIDKLRRKKANRRAKSKQKYAKATEMEEVEEEDEVEEEEVEEEEDEDDYINLEEHRFKDKKKVK